MVSEIEVENVLCSLSITLKGDHNTLVPSGEHNKEHATPVRILRAHEQAFDYGL